MNITEKLPSMTDKDLANLHGNAERLEQAGTPRQQEAAAELLPLIRAEVASRKAAKLAQAQETRRKAKR